jgi:hypothetical protein
MILGANEARDVGALHGEVRVRFSRAGLLFCAAASRAFDAAATHQVEVSAKQFDERVILFL